jgi:nitrogen regulatory protein P-II 2
VSFLPKIKVEVAVNSGLVDAVVETIASVARTGRIGDGKIFVINLEHAVRIRTGDLDAAAI